MDIASILGLLIGFGSLVLAYAMDGGSIGALWLFSAFLIIFGGSLGATVLSYGIKDIMKLPKLVMQTFIPPKSTMRKTIEYIIMLSESARKNGLLSLENIIDSHTGKDKLPHLLERGALMVIDGIDVEQIREALEKELYVYEENSKIEIGMFETLGGYAPAMGMCGTIMGMIKTLANMGEAEKMAHAIAIAFIATLYGVVLANLVFLPIATKLKARMDKYLMEQDMIIEGVCSIRNGVNPKLLRERLSVYLPAGAPGKNGREKLEAKKNVAPGKI